MSLWPDACDRSGSLSTFECGMGPGPLFTEVFGYGGKSASFACLHLLVLWMENRLGLSFPDLEPLRLQASCRRQDTIQSVSLLCCFSGPMVAS